MATVNVWYPKVKRRDQIKRDGWNTSSLPATAYSLVRNVGHASLTLEQENRYVSWWPNADHTSFATPDYAFDLHEEEGPPNATVRLDGLDEAAIAMWWDRVKIDGHPIPFRADFFPADNKWTLDRNNCSHMVLLALEVGGAEQHAKMLRWGAELVTPAQIHAYAMRLKLAMGMSKLLSR